MVFLILIFSMVFLSLAGSDNSKEDLIKKYKLEKSPANIAQMSESFKERLGLSSTSAADLFKEKLDILYETSQKLHTDTHIKQPKFGLNKKQIAIIRARAEQLDNETKNKANNLKPFLSKKEEKARKQWWLRNGERAGWCVISFGLWLTGYYFGHRDGVQDN